MRAGDILAVRGTGWLSRGILEATGNTVSHVGMLVGADPPIIIEALTRVMTRPLEISITDAEAAYLLSDKSLEPDRRSRLVRNACRFSADGYGYGEIALQGLDALTHTTWWSDKLSWGEKKHPICSYLVAAAYGELGLYFGKKAVESITPADIFAFAQNQPEIYDVSKIK